MAPTEAAKSHLIWIMTGDEDRDGVQTMSRGRLLFVISLVWCAVLVTALFVLISLRSGGSSGLARGAIGKINRQLRLYGKA
jgi:hypothetical protein